MKIGVDACCWGNKRGFGRFTRGLLEAILEVDDGNEYIFFVDSLIDGDSIPERATKIVVQTDAAATQAASAEGRRSVKDLLAMSRAVFRHKLDVFFFPAVYSYFPVFNRAKIVVTVHDLIADHHPTLVFPNDKLKFFWKLKQNAAVQQADLILTVSEYSKRQIAEFFHLEDSRLRVIVEGAQPEFKLLRKDEQSMEETRARYNLNSNERFLLYVGGISPHKNLGRLIRAFKRVRQKHADLKLVLVGDYKNDSFFSAYPELVKQITQLNLEEKVIFAGHVADEDLAQLYNAAEMLVFPSLEEGFGLPALEAMACGTPVAASDCSSLPEILGAAGKFFNPYDPQNIGATIEEVLADTTLSEAMSAAGLKRAAEFHWEKAARQTLAVFDEIAGKTLKIKTTASESFN